MKHSILRKLMLIAVLLTGSHAFAYDFEVDGIYYNIISAIDLTVEVTSGDNQYKGKVIIPETVTYKSKDLKVIGIANLAFKRCLSLTSIEIPNSVTSIGNSAFYSCSGLKSVTIGNSVTSIGNHAVYGCSGLTSVTIPNSVTSIGGGAFSYCSGLTSVTIPNSVTSIRESAFSGCSGLTSVTIPNSVTSIGEHAFYSCNGLKSVTIPNSVTSIGNYAFYGCSGLTSVTIPNSVTSIGGGAFYICSGLTSVTFESTTPPTIGESAFYGVSNATFNTPSLISVLAYKAIEELKNKTFASHEVAGVYYLPTSETEVEVTYKDKNYDSYTGDVVIPSEITVDEKKYNVTSIGNKAFKNCTGLTNLTIPNSVTSIGSQAFFSCSSLTSVTIPNSVTSIENSAFYNCSGLTYIELPSTITNIGGYAFASGYNNSTNSYDYITRTIKCNTKTPPTLGDNVFDYNNLTLEVPFESIPEYKAVEAWTKNSYGSLTYKSKEVDGIYYISTSDTEVEVTFKDKNYNSYAGDVVIPAEITVDDIKYNVTSIGYSAFSGCSGLTSVTIPNSVTSIGNYAFYNCSGLTSVTIPNSVTSIGSQAFFSCSSLTSVTIPNSVTSIGNSAFSGCSGLKNVTFESATPPTIGQSAFYGVSNATFTMPFASILAYKALNELQSKTFASHKVDGIYYLPTSETEVEVTFKDKNYNSYAGDVVIPSEITVDEKKYNVTSIGEYAFYNCSGLKNVTIGNSVTSIGEDAFRACSGLTSVTIPNSVTSIGNSAFSDCSGLTSVTIGNSVTSIGEYAFCRCNELTSVYISKSVNTISNYAFQSCYGLTSVTFESTTPPTIGKSAFDGVSAMFKTPFASILAYKAHEELKNMNFASHEIDGFYYLPTSDTEVEVTFKDKNYNSYVGDVVIPAEITVDDKKYKVTSIGNRAFYNCTDLTNVTIPEGVTSIGDGVFSWSSSLISVTISNSVTTIGNEAFYVCTNLASLKIPNNVTSIGAYAFYKCEGLTSITIPNSVTTIGDSAFGWSSGLTNVTFESATPPTIGKSAFYGVSAMFKTPFASILAYKAHEELKNMNFASHEIDGFYYLPTSDTEVEVTYRGRNHGTYTGNIVIPSEITVDKKKYNVTSISNSAFGFSKALTSIIIPKSVKTIGSSAFNYCTALTNVSISEGVTSIGSSAFYGCNNLNGKLSLPSSITSIGESAFSGTKYYICEISATTPPTISSSSLSAETSLVLVPNGSRDTYKAAEVWETYKTSIVEKGSCDIEVTVKEGEDETLDDAIWYQTDASNAYITGLKVHGTLSQEDFELIKTNMTSLLDLDISDTDVTEIPAEIFKDKPTLMKIKLPNGLKSIGDYAFSGCKVLTNELVIPETVETIGSYAFQNCVSIDNILVIPASVKSIGNYAFSGCTQIDILDMSCATSLESINDHAFSGCTSLESVKFSTVLKSIGSYVFYNCKKLDNFTLPASLESIYSYAFNGCTSLTTLNFESCKSLTCIDNYTFSGCTSLENIKFPTSLETIGSYAFQNCRNITTLDFAGCELLTSINSTSFNGCTGLNVLNMVDCTSLTTINSNSFSTCTSLKTVNFPSSLASVGEKAFANCEQLMNISVPCETPPAIDANAEPFYGVDNIECILTYPTSLMRDYYKANYWGAFIKRDVKTNIDVEVEKPEDDTTGDDTTEEEEDNENQFGGGHKPGYGGHIWYDKDWHKHHKHPGKPSRAKSIGGIKLLDETTESIVPTTDVSGIKGFVEDGLSMYVQNGDSVTFLIQPEAGYVIESVSYGGEDVTTQIVDGVFITPAVSGKNIKLQVSFAKETANVLLGDVNGDGEVNVTDITTLISYILGNTEGVNSAVVDINNDGEVNVTDVTTLISMILGTN